MMAVRVETKGFKAVDDYLRKKGVMPEAAFDRGLTKWIVAAHRKSLDLLGGGGSDAPGSYPVPIHTGNLRRGEDYIAPGESKHGISAGSGMAVLVNTAAYATSIHNGNRVTRSGTRYMVRPRPFQIDAVEATRETGMRHMMVEVRRDLTP